MTLEHNKMIVQQAQQNHRGNNLAIVAGHHGLTEDNRVGDSKLFGNSIYDDDNGKNNMSFVLTNEIERKNIKTNAVHTSLTTSINEKYK